MRWLQVINYCYGFFVFGLMCFLFMPITLPLALFPESMRRRVQPLIRAITHKAFIFVRWHCQVTGFARMELHDLSQGHDTQLLVANHISMFDIVLLFAFFPDIHTLVNAKFLNNPLLWPIIRSCGYISLRTDRPDEGFRTFQEMMEILQAGGRLVLFPEGTRSSDGRLGPLKNGPFRLAADSQIPITPVFFTSNQPFLNRRAFFPREKGPVLLRAYIMPACRMQAGEWQDARAARAEFIRAYEEFVRSDLALDWNRAGAVPISSSSQG